MQLSAIDVEGFKSFAKKTHLAFKPGITAVIGPNGSGKSNVTEAIRWVLGEQSIKQLRGKESTDVIFHGTNESPASRRAKVTLTFQNESGRFPGGAPEVAIGRSLSRNGESHYTVNGDDVRLLDLQRSLAEAGVGARTFTVISQGMVDRYLTATPKERKELFDEATGVRALQIQLIDAHRKLQKTQLHAGEIETIIQELAPRLTVLERQVKRYELWKILASQFSTQQTAWFYHTWHNLMGQTQKIADQLTQLQETITSKRAQRQRLERSLFAHSQDTAGATLRQQLARAESDYTHQRQTYEQHIQQKKTLEDSLAEISTRKAIAEQHLAEARKTSLKLDWIAQTEQLLKTCLSLLASVIAGRDARAQATQLHKNIELFLQELHQTPAAEKAKRMMQAVETPLQEVARLTAIENERKQQLKELPTITAPTDDAIQQAEEALQIHQKSTKDPISSDETGSLERIREEELEAERSASAAKAALEQLRKELAELEGDILREQGTNALQRIQQAPPNQFPEAPSIESLRSLAQKLAAIGEADPLVEKEYVEAKERYEHLSSQLADVRQAANNLVDLMGNLHKQMQQQFSERFAIIRDAFSSIFVGLFGGGKATISQTEEGVEISVTPPGKRSRHVTLLSGGERALTSLALLMAILEAHQPPFIVLDEVDAALDEANSRRFALMLKERCKNTQCIVVTHNREVMAASDVLYGVTMAQEGVSSVYSVTLSDIAATEQVVESTAIGV